MRKSNLILFLLTLTLASAAFGSTMTGLPWESPLQTIGNSLTGPVAGIISLIAIAICGITAAIGHDLSGFVKTLLGIVMIVSVVLGAASLIRILFGTTGAVVSPAAIVQMEGGEP